MSDSCTPSRAQLRRSLRAARRSLSPSAQKQAALRLYRQLAHSPVFWRARRIALYLPNDGEIDPKWIIQAAWRQKKKLYLPRLAAWPQQHMVFQRFRQPDRLKPNRFGILEPACNPKTQISPRILNLILMPLVGFDPYGGRLGMGGGFYDRSLAFIQRRTYKAHPPTLLGLAHECQKVSRLPLASWDIPLDGIVTDAAWYGHLSEDPA